MSDESERFSDGKLEWDRAEGGALGVSEFFERQAERRAAAAEARLAAQHGDSFVGVGCLHVGRSPNGSTVQCTNGAEYVPEVGPGPGWISLAERGFVCPEHAAAAHEAAVNDLEEEIRGFKAKLAEAERLRDKWKADNDRLRGWIRSHGLGDWDHTDAEFAHYALRGYDVPPPDDRLLPDLPGWRPEGAKTDAS